MAKPGAQAYAWRRSVVACFPQAVCRQADDGFYVRQTAASSSLELSGPCLSIEEAWKDAYHGHALAEEKK